MTEHVHTLRLILGDQLNAGHRWFRKTDPGVVYVMAELHQETGYVTHHVQKICAFFLAMQKFAARLQKQGHRVRYLDLDETARHDDLGAVLKTLVNEYKPQWFEYQQPDEYRVAAQLSDIVRALPVTTDKADTEHFLVPFDEISAWFDGARVAPMETFYRRIRQHLSLLMDDGKPMGGRWNFDSENRKALPAREPIPDPMCFTGETDDIIDRLSRHKVATIGSVDRQLIWPTDRDEALQLLHFFLKECLPQFGRYQDAMTHRGWSLFHSRLSFPLNTKLISPAEVVQAAVDTFECNRDMISMAQVEGFVRQIIGWREYIRGMYWTLMPGYRETNYFGHTNALPAFFWNGETQMACLRSAVKQSLHFAYAHHIQRLMITGNYALLNETHPDEVDEWYLGIYIDALEWVEMPNTRGMSQYADGGLIATKPYVSSGNYINRMSDHCKQCRYDVKQRTGPDACPFNALYWDFLDQKRDALGRHHRMRMMYANLDRIDANELRQIRRSAEYLKAHPDQL